MLETIPEITKRYLGTQSMEEFAFSLGVNATRQTIWNWKTGVKKPSIMTLFRVIGSERATHAAKEFARECINVLQAEAGMEFEDNLDSEIERRR